LEKPPNAVVSLPFFSITVFILYTQSFLKNVFRNHHWELGLPHFYRCSIHINSIAGTPLTLTMINTGMWIQGRFLGKG
jgi:hypothetical protein